MNDKSCINCRYDLKNINEEPCIDCINKPGFIKWEPDEEMQRVGKMNEKRCTNCRHRLLSAMKQPCADCGMEKEFDRWEPAEPEPAGKQIKLEKRPEIMPAPVPIYEHTDSEIPERVRILFTNGTSAIYDLHTDQPAPVIIENIKIIRRMKQGYVNQPMRRRRRK